MKEEDAAAFKEEQLLLTPPVQVLPWDYAEVEVPSVDTTTPTQCWDE